MLPVAVVARIPVVDHRRRDIDGYAPESVDYVLETGEIDEHVVRDVEPVGVAQSLLEGVGSAPGEQVPVAIRVFPQGVELVVEARAPQRGQTRVRRHRKPVGVSRHAEHRDCVGHRVQAHDDHRVRPKAAALLVRPDQQNVESAIAVPRLRRRRRQHRPLGRERHDWFDRAGRVGAGGSDRHRRMNVLERRVQLQIPVAGERVACRHHEQDRRKARQGKRVDSEPGPIRTRVPAREVFRVRADGDAIGVDCRQHAISEEQHVEDDKRTKDGGLADPQSEVAQPVADEEPADQTQADHRDDRKADGPHVGSGVGVPQARHDERKESRRKGRPLGLGPG